MVEENRQEVQVEELPAVCGLCFNWILEGQATVKMVDGPVHRECWRRGEANE